MHFVLLLGWGTIELIRALERSRVAEEERRQRMMPTPAQQAFAAKHLQRLINEAEAYRQQVAAQAQGEAARFVSVYTAYKQAEDVTKQRLYLETMEQILRGVNKVVVDEALGGQGIVPYLPLNELNQPRRAAPQPQTGPSAPAQAQGVR